MFKKTPTKRLTKFDLRPVVRGLGIVKPSGRRFESGEIA